MDSSLDKNWTNWSCLKCKRCEGEGEGGEEKVHLKTHAVMLVGMGKNWLVFLVTSSYSYVSFVYSSLFQSSRMYSMECVTWYHSAENFHLGFQKLNIVWPWNANPIVSNCAVEQFLFQWML